MFYHNLSATTSIDFAKWCSNRTLYKCCWWW